MLCEGFVLFDVVENGFEVVVRLSFAKRWSVGVTLSGLVLRHCWALDLMVVAHVVFHRSGFSLFLVSGFDFLGRAHWVEVLVVP